MIEKQGERTPASVGGGTFTRPWEKDGYGYKEPCGVYFRQNQEENRCLNQLYKDILFNYAKSRSFGMQ